MKAKRRPDPWDGDDWRRGKLYDNWLTYHSENPHIGQYMERFVRELWRAGFRTYGVREVMGRIRWEIHTATTGRTFKISNNHAAYYARWFMESHPRYGQFFHTRRLGGGKADHVNDV